MSLKDISVIGNKWVGMHLESCNTTTLANIYTADNNGNGLELYSCSNINMKNVSATYNQLLAFGMYFESCSSMRLKDIYAIGNAWDGMYLVSCSNSTLTNIHTTNNLVNGMQLYSCNNIEMRNVYTTYNQPDGNGMYFDLCSSIHLKDISVMNNTNGMYFLFCDNLTFTSIYTENNLNNGTEFYSCSNISMTNVSATYNQLDGHGMYFESCNSMNLRDISVNNNWHGMDMESCNDTTLTSISAANNQWNGIELKSCIRMSMKDISVANNTWSGMHLESCINTDMKNIKATNNHIHGLYVHSCKHVRMMMMYIQKNQDIGMYFLSCKNTTTMNTSVTHNQNRGIITDMCTNTVLADVTVMYSQNGGILIKNDCVNISLRNISVHHNGNAQITFSQLSSQLEDSVFSDVVALSTLATDPRTTPTLIELNNSTLTLSNCIFSRNDITPIRAINSTIIVQGEITFSDNHALSGAALLFDSSSVLQLTETSSILFQNNSAINYGGAIYIITDEKYKKSKSLHDVCYQFSPSLVTPSTKCFLSVNGDRSQPKLTFSNNTAGKGGEVVYGGLVALGYDGDWNCLLSFKNISDMSQQNSMSVISSAPSHVCLCHDGKPDCLTVAYPTIRNIYPGQTITLPAVVVGQDFGTVTGSVIAQFLQTYDTCSIDLEEGQQSTLVNNGKCTDLKYTLYSRGGENCTATLTLKTNNAEVLQLMNKDDNQKLYYSWAVLNDEPNYHKLASRLLSETIAMKKLEYYYFVPYLTANNYSEVLIKDFLKFSSDAKCSNVSRTCKIAKSVKFVFPKEIYSYPTFINVSFNSCPLGFALSRNRPFKCDCNDLLQQMPQVKCEIQHQTISRGGLVWVGTYDNETVAASKYCPYNYCKSMHTKITLTAEESDSENSNHSTTDFQCNQHHSGVLCGGCQPGLSLALGTNRCLPCSNAYISLLLPFGMAGLLLIFFIKLLNLTISQGTMNELIFYVNVVSANKYLYYNQTSVNPMTLFIAWLNLDIGIETCFVNGLTAYIKTWLQFVFPLYIWAIAGAIIFIAKYSDRVAKVMGNNGVPVLATLFLLSYAKLFNTIITAVSYTTLYTTQGRKLVWSADGNVDYLGPKHIPLFGVAVAALLFLCLPYTLILLLGQWLHRLNCHFITRMLLNLKPFLDAHFAAFKDEYRYWFGLLLLVRVANLLISASIPDNTTGITEFSTAIICIILTFWGRNVYHSSAVGTFGTTFLVNLAIMNVTKLFSNISNGNTAVGSFTLIAIALVQFLGLILYKTVAIFKHNHKMMVCCVCEKEPDDDWELYEQAALEREMESNNELNRDSNVSQSIESVPSYGL